MADLPKSNTDEMIDKPPVGMSQATLRIHALQVVAGALIVAAIALIAHGLLTPACAHRHDAGPFNAWRRGHRDGRAR